MVYQEEKEEEPVVGFSVQMALIILDALAIQPIPGRLDESFDTLFS